MTKEFPVGSRRGTFSAVGYYTLLDNSGAVANAGATREESTLRGSTISFVR